MSTDAYRAAGVDIDAGNRAVALMKGALRSTYTAGVLADVGSFGGLFALGDLPENPVLVASIDGVGTKVKLAAEHGRWRGLGHDIVNHCVNDILVQGATPLFFLDYVASSALKPATMAEVVTGMAEACRAVGCAILGGETAEMPGVYTPGAIDIAGAVVGIVGRAALMPRKDEMQAGDLLVGLPSSGPHTNGYSLIRRAITDKEPDALLTDGRALVDALLEPHRCYLSDITRARAAGLNLRGIAHITGGGLQENVPRILPEHLAARLDARSWPVPELFQRLVEWSGIGQREAYRVFNMGIGMVLVVPATIDRALLREVLPGAVEIGRLETRTGEAMMWDGMAE
jgi:phosphoribosylformylglycinamidine cyclo-ligase